MNTYKINKEIKRWLRHVFIKGYHLHRFVICENNQVLCKVNVSEAIFEKMLKRALCEKISREEGNTKFYVTEEEFRDKEFMAAAMEFMCDKEPEVIYIDGYEELLFCKDTVEEVKREKYKVDRKLKENLKRFLIRSYHVHFFSEDDKGQLWCEIGVTEDAFARILDRARCEKASNEDGGDTFYVTAREAIGGSFPTYMLDFLGRSSHSIADFSKFMEMMYGDNPEDYKEFDRPI